MPSRAISGASAHMITSQTKQIYPTQWDDEGKQLQPLARSELHDRRGGKSVLYSLDLAKQICKLIAQNVLVAINSTFRRTHHRTPSFLTVPAPIGNTSDALSKSVFVVTDAHDNAQSFAFS